ncbi:hypothetical protein BT63DRAFT_427892 [Microthyrium microscopicum]|uniref:Mid2 domain-containing protein n=1 Tax=Microthyrium microscopicum TaxID=703497 RepID=A0A6A6U3T5_9PEZI|nr:hypothetical protein BT63DRAFT_427892 [Microthyrium microscopicum]
MSTTVTSAHVTITQSPSTLVPPTNDAAFQGYYLNAAGTPSPVRCGTGSVYSSGTHLECCTEANSADCASTVVAYCTGNSLMRGTQVRTCDGTGYFCRSITVYPSSGGSDPASYFINCAQPGYVVNTLYQNVVLQANITETLSDSSESQASTGSSPTSTSGGTTQNKSSGSKAWIAGAVVGPIVGLALLVGLIFFCMRRNKKKKAVAAAPTQDTTQYGGPNQYGSQYGSPNQQYPSPHDAKLAPVPYGSPAATYDSRYSGNYQPVGAHSPHMQATGPVELPNTSAVGHPVEME